MRPALTAIALGALVLGLTGCLSGGGSSTASKPDDGNTSGPPPGLRPALEIPQLQVARSEEIASRADTLMMTAMHGESSVPGLTTYVVPLRCIAAECSFTDPTDASLQTLSIREAMNVGLVGERTSLGSKLHITLTDLYGKFGGRVDAVEYTVLGAWLDHSGFATETRAWKEPRNISATSRQAMAAGDLTGSALTESASWKGLMVAVPRGAGGHGTRIFGDATLEYEFGGTLDVTFSGLSDLDGGAFHTAVIEFHDLEVDGEGVFKDGQPGNRIHGGFFGPKHTEAAGTFESMNLLGAFGARRLYTVVIQSEAP